jgi:hypothetical protein
MRVKTTVLMPACHAMLKFGALEKNKPISLQESYRQRLLFLSFERAKKALFSPIETSLYFF